MAKQKKTTGKIAQTEEKVEDTSDDLDIKIYRVPAGQRRAGYFTFTINGKESAYYSTNKDGLTRTIKAIMFGRPEGQVTLKAVRAGAKPQETQATGKKDPNPWSLLQTVDERVKGFLNRGRLKDGELQPRED